MRLRKGISRTRVGSGRSDIKNSNKNNPEEFERIYFSLKAIGGGVWDYNISKDVLYCNGKWYSILGIPHGAPRITSIEEFRKHIHPDDADQATDFDEDHVNRLIANDQRYHNEFRIIRADGVVRWLRSVACIIRDEIGDLRAIGCVTDITEIRAGFAGPPQPVAAMPDPSPPEPVTALATPLTDKERECLLWVSIGKTAWETAAILGRSQRTVEFHLGNAVRKLNASNKVHAAFIAIRQNLI